MGYRKRDFRIEIRTTGSIHKRFSGLAKKAGISKTELFERTFEDKEIVNMKQFTAVYVELKHQGNNLNQITKSINSGKYPPSFEVLQELKKTQDELKKTMDMLLDLS